MKKVTFWILLFVEFLCCWLSTDVLFGDGWLIALMLTGGNLLFVNLCYRKFVEWFEPPETDASAVPNAVLAVTAAEVVLFQILHIGILSSI